MSTRRPIFDLDLRRRLASLATFALAAGCLGAYGPLAYADPSTDPEPTVTAPADPTAPDAQVDEPTLAPRMVAVADNPGALPAGAPDTDVEPGSIVGGHGYLDLTMGGRAVVTQQEETVIGPGVVLTQWERLEPGGWQRGAVLDIDLSHEAVSMDYLYTGKVADTGTLTELTDASQGVAAAVNGDFFDINDSGAPIGIGLDEEDGLIKSSDGAPNALMISEDNVAMITEAITRGSVVAGGETLMLGGVNPLGIESDEVALFTHHWGEHQRLTRNDDAAASGIEVWVDAQGKVMRSQPVSDEVIPEGVRVVAARPGPAADVLASLPDGASVQIEHSILTDLANPVVGIGSGAYLVQDGAAVVSKDPNAHPRTAAGVSQDGRRLVLAVVDGRSTDSRGMTLTELGELMAQLGSHTALNLDGGGSTTLSAREPGEKDPEVRNDPSDGKERSDGNGIGVVITPGTGELDAFRVRPVTAADGATRVFPGLHRDLVARGVDDHLTPVEGSPEEWSVDDATRASVDADGVVTGASRGPVQVRVSGGGAEGTLDMEVLGDLARLTSSSLTISLENADQTGTLALTGYDSDGYAAPIDVRDIDVDVPEGYTVEPLDGNTLVIGATIDSGSTVLTFTVGEHRIQIPVTVGSSSAPITDLADAAQWAHASDRATGSLAVVEDPEGDTAIELNHDFTQSTGTRGSYAVAPGGGIEIEGQPTRITMQMRGDGTGAWPRLQMRAGDGSTVQVNASAPQYVTFEGWQTVSFDIPAGTAYPLTLQRVRLMETGSRKQYEGSVAFSDLVAHGAPEVEMPSGTIYHDPAVSPAGSVDDKPLRIAVISDLQFVGENPDSALVQTAREGLRELVAEAPDRIIILGDFVDEGEVDDIELAQRVLDEELGDSGIPWQYVPGNHEAMKAEDLGPWQDAFGDLYTVTDVDSTRIITLNSAPYIISHMPEQVQFLREQLDAAAEDDSITGVVLAMHHPTRDAILDQSALRDPQDAAMIEKWTAELQAAGKSTVVLGAGVGAFDVYQVDGVTHVVNGNAGKSPSSTPGRGGFSGWTMLGIDPSQGLWRDNHGTWLDVEVNPFVEDIKILGPWALRPGQVAQLQASVLQDDRSVPASWPVSVRWSAQDGAYLGDAQDAGAADAVAVNGSGQVTVLDRAIVDGEVVPLTDDLELTGGYATTLATVAVLVNDVEHTRTLTVTFPVAEAPAPVSPFVDVDPSDEHFAAMLWAYEEGIAKGWADGTYRPLEGVNRDAMAAFLYRMAGEPAVDLPASSPFTDVKPGDEHYAAIVWAHQEGITTGWSDGSFRPTQPIARDAMAAFLYRYAGSPEVSAPSTDPFSDVSRSSKFALEIAWMKEEGISTGWSDGTYRPLQDVNRDAMAAFLYRMQVERGIERAD